MIKTLHNLFLLATTFLLVGEAGAQIVINRANFPAEDRISQTYEVGYASQSKANIIAKPAEGMNKTWDYSQVSLDGFFSTDYFANDNTGIFANASYYFEQNRAVAQFPYKSRLYFQVDDNGTRQMGRIQQDTSHSLTMITGGANDKAQINSKEVPFTKTADLLKFPVKYESEWSGTGVVRVYFNLTIQAYGMNNTPFYLESHRRLQRHVVGEGQIKIPVKSGETSKSIDVLLIKSEELFVDSVFTLDGNEAPPSLLQAFNFKQGDTSTNVTVYFYVAKNFGYTVAEVMLDEQGDVESANFTMAANDISTSVRSVNSAEHTVYPTFLSAGQSIQFSFNEPYQIKQLRIVGMDGREWKPKADDNSMQFTLPASMPGGVYTYLATDTNSKKRLVGKLIVR